MSPPETAGPCHQGSPGEPCGAGVSPQEQGFIRRALRLARRGLGHTSPNPAVGAVLVRDGVVVGEGYHRRAGEPHAEAVALQAAGALARGATLYVTLEPCSHWGRTPPCADALIAAGVRRVVACCIDPNPRVNGRGFARLRQAGIEVALAGPADRERARSLNMAYEKYITLGLPYVTLKTAMSLDGKTATASGDSRWITGEQARAAVHRLRAVHDAILVGVGTVLADNPRLTARPGGRPARRQPLRVVADSLARTPVDSALLKEPGEVLIAVTPRAPEERVRALQQAGARVLTLPADADGRVDLRELMRALAAREVTSVLAEGGGTLAASLLSTGLADRLLVFIAPKILGGATAPTPVEGPGVLAVAQALPVRSWQVRRLREGELVVDARLRELPDLAWAAEKPLKVASL